MKCFNCDFEIPENTKICPNCGTCIDDLKSTINMTGGLEDESLSFTPGESFGDRYIIIEEIGRGGMGRIFKARDKVLDIDVAIKMIHPELLTKPNTVQRFKKETLLARQIANENIVRLYDFGDIKGIKFISMEFINGENLAELIQTSGKLSIETTINIAKQICLGLHAAHSKGIIHRDLKPHNIMIDKNGEVVITDFGLAKSLDDQGITCSGTVVGTPHYLSPEQAKGERADKRSDIYALGIIMYEMVTGRDLFTSETVIGYLQKHIHEKPVPPSTYNPLIPGYLDRIILKCLMKSPGDRYKDALEVLDDLEKKKTQSGPILLSSQAKKKIKLGAAIISVLFTVIAIYFLVFFEGKCPAPPPPFKKLSVALLPFTNPSGQADMDKKGRMLQHLTGVDLAQSSYLRVMDEEELFPILRKNQQLGKKKYSQQDLTSIADSVKVDVVISGEYLEPPLLSQKSAGPQEQPQALVQLQIYNAQAKEFSEDNFKNENKNDIYPLIEQIADFLEKKLLSRQEYNCDKKRNNPIDIAQISKISPQAYSYYLDGQDYYWQRKIPESIAAFKRAIALEPSFALPHLSLGIIYLDEENLEQADNHLVRAYNLASQKPVKSKQDYLVIASCSNLRGDSPLADGIAAYQELLNKYPGYERARFFFGVFYRNREEWGKAEKQFKKIIENHMSSRQAVSNLGFVYMASGKYNLARELIDDYKAIFPLAPVQNQSAHIHLYKGELDAALEEIKRYLGNDPVPLEENPVYHRWIGLYHHFSNHFQAAEDSYRKAIELAGVAKKAEYFLELGSLYLTQGKYQECKEQMAYWLDWAENAGLKLFFLKFKLLSAYIDLRLANPTSALETARQVEAAAGSIIYRDVLLIKKIALHFQGWALLLEEKIDGAEEIADKLKQLIERTGVEKHKRYCKHLRALIDKKRGSIFSAVQYFNEALLVTPYWFSDLEDRSFFIMPLADVSKTGDPKNAEALYKKVQTSTMERFKWGDNYALSYYYLAEIYREQGDEENARLQYEKFLDLWKNADPGIPQLLDAREKLASMKK